MDSAGYSENSLKTIKNMRWWMRVPETLAEAKRLVNETIQEKMVELIPGYFGKEVKSEYGGVAQRWLVIFSQGAYERELKTMENPRQRTERSHKAVSQSVSTSFQLP